MRHVEELNQTYLIGWARLYRMPQAPDIEPGAKLSDYLYAIPNGGRRNPREAGRMKAQGVKAGVSDLHLPVARRGHTGLWIEMKTTDGRESPEQKKWRARMERAGHRALVCRSWREAMEQIRAYLEEPPCNAS